MKNTRHKNIFIPLALIGIISISFFIPRTAHASSSSWNPLTDAITGGVYFASVVINELLSVFISLGALLITFGLNLSTDLFSSPTIQLGFSVALALANLGFVLGIIVIAIATILRNQTYGIKQLLWKLVVMAILVNFGLVIAGPIVGIANSLSNYFVQSTGGNSGFATTLTNAFAPQSLTQAPNITSNSKAACDPNAGATETALCQQAQQAIKNSGSAGSEFTRELLSMLFSAVFEAIVAFTFFLIGILLIIRYLYLAILLVLLPLAWLTWILPSFSKHFSEWWSVFIKWSFFPAIMLFFIYIALQSVTMVNGSVTVPAAAIPSDPSGSAAALTVATGQASGPNGLIQTALDEILLVGLCIGGIFASQKLSITGASAVIGGGKGAGKWAGKQFGKGAKYAKDRTAERLRTAGKKTENGETTTALQRAGSRLQGVPVPFAGSLGSKIAAKGAVTPFHEEKKEEIQKYTKEKLASVDNAGIIARANKPTAFVNAVEAAAIAGELGRRNLFKDPKISPDLTKRFIDNAEKMGNVQSILNNRPELAAQTSAAKQKTDPTTGAFTETVAEAVARAIGEATNKIKVADITNINDKSLGDHTGSSTPSDEQTTVALNMSPQQLKKLVTEGSTEQIKAFKNTINELILSGAGGTSTLSSTETATLLKLEKYISHSPEWMYV